MFNILSAALHSNRDIVLNVALNEIASLFLPKRITAHFKFKNHVSCPEFFICNIEKKIRSYWVVAYKKADNLGLDSHDKQVLF